MAAENASALPPLDKEQAMFVAEAELEYRVELFYRLNSTCFKKCIDTRFKDSELNMGENSCIDRCVAKYWEVNNMIGQMLGGRAAGQQ